MSPEYSPGYGLYALFIKPHKAHSFYYRISASTSSFDRRQRHPDRVIFAAYKPRRRQKTYDHLNNITPFTFKDISYDGRTQPPSVASYMRTRLAVIQNSPFNVAFCTLLVRPGSLLPLLAMAASISNN